MSEVLHCENRFKKKVRKNNLDIDRYECAHCKSDLFKLGADGDVFCAGCTCRMRQLRILDAEGR